MFYTPDLTAYHSSNIKNIKNIYPTDTLDEWQSTHPPYQLIPHTNSTPVHNWVDQLIPSPPTAITNSSPRPSILYQLIPSHRPSVTNSSPTHDYIVGYLNCFKVRHTGSHRLLILWECNKTHLLLEEIYFI